MGKIKDLSGKVFGRLTVLRRADDKLRPDGRHYSMWQCRCECDNEVTVQGNMLSSGNTQSCGCYHRDVARIAGADSRKYADSCWRKIYDVRRHMIARCNDKKNCAYDRYGGRDIRVCQQWMDSFDEFYQWAIASGYRENLTLDRINVNDGYHPDNCRLATAKEQANTRRCNHSVSYMGITKTIAEWCDVLILPYQAVLQGVNKLGWSGEDAITKPIRTLRREKDGNNHSEQVSSARQARED